MNKFQRGILGPVALLLLCGVVAAGCGGSSRSTSRADAATVAAAERDFLAAWRRSNVTARGLCEAKYRVDFADCFQRAAKPREVAAEADFKDAIEGTLADGVGSECAAALEEALVEMFAIPLFPGNATATCRAESRRAS